LSQKRQFFRQIFVENILKILTSVPGFHEWVRVHREEFEPNMLRPGDNVMMTIFDQCMAKQ
jgi:hypothetical protein